MQKIPFKLDKSIFLSKVIVKALMMKAKDCGLGLKMFKNSGFLLERKRLPTIVSVPAGIEGSDPSFKLLLLSTLLVDIPPELEKFRVERNGKLVDHWLEIDYDYYSVEEVFAKILPPEVDAPQSFSTIGHIAHLNLRKEYDPYKFVIGQVILDKIPSIKTVVNKTNSIDHTYRFFSMELLAGENNTVARVKEGNCFFNFDFAKVYWNSRLQTEHNRIVSLLKPGDVICDVFAGVGPFALPAAKHGCIVFANDLNPSSYEFLTENVKTNKLSHRIASFNTDGRDFILKSLNYLQDDIYWTEFAKGLHFSVRRNDQEAPKKIAKAKKFDHYLMNLPATATEFLDSFKGLFKGFDPVDLPMIHCYSFSKAKNLVQDTIERTEAIVGTISKTDLNVHKVRNVAPGKEMMCISFRLPTEFALGTCKKRKAGSP